MDDKFKIKSKLAFEDIVGCSYDAKDDKVILQHGLIGKDNVTALDAKTLKEWGKGVGGNNGGAMLYQASTGTIVNLRSIATHKGDNMISLQFTEAPSRRSNIREVELF